MNCRRATELMTDYLEGSLSAAERTRFEAHLALCDGCTAYLEQMRTTVAVVGRLGEADVPPAAREQLMDAFRSWRGT